MVEQDHRGIKNITKYTLGFKSFEAAEATISGIKLHRMLKNLDRTGFKDLNKQQGLTLLIGADHGFFFKSR